MRNNSGKAKSKTNNRKITAKRKNDIKITHLYMPQVKLRVSAAACCGINTAVESLKNVCSCCCFFDFIWICTISMAFCGNRFAALLASNRTTNGRW